MSIQVYRDKEIDKIVEQAFVQFNITDLSEKQEITNSIKQQLDSSDSLSNFQESIYASSGKYRADVRASLIDIIAHLFHVRDMELKLSKIEAKSRDITTSANNRLTILENKFHNLDDNIRESFEEGVHSGVHAGTIVKDGKLRIDKAQVLVPLNNLEIEVHPTNSNVNNVVVETSKNKDVLITTGLASDSYNVNVTTPIEPSIYISNGFLAGVVVSIKFETEEPIVPSVISSKASASFRIQAVHAGIEKDTYTTNLGRDTSLGAYSFVEPTSTTEYKYFKVYLYFPDHTINNSLLEYNFNIHNIRLFEKSEGVVVSTGTFVSNTYTSKSPILGVKINSSFLENINFKLKFEKTDFEQYVIPKGLIRTFTIYKEIETPIIDISPFKIKAGSFPTITLADGTAVSTFEISEDRYSIILTEEAAIYNGYLFITYETNSQVTTGYSSARPNEAFIPTSSDKTEYHDGIEPYTFKLSSIPFMYAPESGIPNFIFYKNNVEVSAIDLTDLDNSTTEFSDPTEGNEFYYKDGFLYTNFSLVDGQYKIFYRYTCDGVSLELELFNNATIDDYFIELITLGGFSYASAFHAEN